MIIGRAGKMILGLVAIAVMLMFSEMNAATLFATIVGSGLIMLGLATRYRPASAVGLMVSAASYAISNNPGSLTDLPSLLNAVLGLLIPLYVLAWVSLSAGTEELAGLRFRSRASTATVGFMLACVLSVPVTALLLGLVAPRFSMAMSVLTEIAIVLAVASVGIIVLSSRNPKGTRAIEPTQETESG